MEKKEAAEAADLKSVLEYIQEREGDLARATEKLRTNVERIANIFGEKEYCQICGRHVMSSIHFQYCERKTNRVFDGIPEQIEGAKIELVSPDFDRGRWGDPERKVHYIEEREHHKFMPKIFVSIEVTDDESFYESEDDEGEIEKYFLTTRQHDLEVEVCYRGEVSYYVKIANLPRQALKELVRSERISKFLEKVSKGLEITGKNYEEVAEVAERLATVLPQQGEKK